MASLSMDMTDLAEAIRALIAYAKEGRHAYMGVDHHEIYKGPKTLRYAIASVCPIGADVKQK